MEIIEKIAHRSNYGAYRDKSIINWIVIHYTGNDGDKSFNNANYFQNNKYLGASAHLFVDDNAIYRSVPNDYIAYSVGSKTVDRSEGGGKYYGMCTNKNSISIEMCDTNRNGKYDVTEKTLSNTIELTKELIKEFNIPISHVIRHFDVTGKHCPAYFIKDSVWNEQFKSRLYPKDGWVKNGNDWFYYENSEMVVNKWITYKTSYYYLKSDGAMASKEFVKSQDYNTNSKLYWCNEDGTWDCESYRWMKDDKGWWIAQIGGKWYPKSEWCCVDGKQYYFNKKGYMVTGTKTIDGRIYSFNKDGALVG